MVQTHAAPGAYVSAGCRRHPNGKGLFRQLVCLSLVLCALYALSALPGASAQTAAAVPASAESELSAASVVVGSPHSPIGAEETTAAAAPTAEATETLASAKADTETVEPELSSAASVVLESAHGMESAVVGDINASASPASSSSIDAAVTTETPVAKEEAAASIEPELSAASVVVQSAHGMETPAVEEIIAAVKDASVEPAPTETAAAPVETEPVEEESDDDLFNFLGDLGLSDSGEVMEDGPLDDYIYDEDEEVELTVEEQIALQRRQEEEQREARIRNTAETRAQLEAQMAQFGEALNAMAKDKNKQLRKALVAMRKAAVAKMNDEKTEIGSQLLGLEKEGDKLLKGLDSFLKKELKNKSANPVDRAERWATVVSKLEDKLLEKIQVAQFIMQQFHSDLKNAEVNEGMAIIQQVKDACGQAQGDIGLPLSWLNDVTWQDWQVYHDLARIGEKFQAEASEIQAGTHAHPPVDPFIPRMKQMEEDLENLVNSFVERINEVKQQASAAFAKAVVPEPESPPREVRDEL